jgi:hypothetical protein
MADGAIGVDDPLEPARDVVHCPGDRTSVLVIPFAPVIENCCPLAAMSDGSAHVGAEWNGSAFSPDPIRSPFTTVALCSNRLAHEGEPLRPPHICGIVDPVDC